jgi:hypothetical protein
MRYNVHNVAYSVIFILWFHVRHICKISKSEISCVMSVRMEQLGSHWTDFYEILYFENLSR